MRKFRRKKQACTKIIIENAKTERLSHDARAIARNEGKTVFIQGALSNEIIDYEIHLRKKDYDEAKLLHIHNPSHDRIEPLCQYYTACGGCSLQHMDNDYQINFKQGILLDSLRRIGHCGPDELIAPIRGPIWHYRNKARLSVRYVQGKNGHLVGFREQDNAHFISDIDRCLILNKSVGLGISNLRTLLDKFEGKNNITQIELAAGDESVALVFRNMDALSMHDQSLLEHFSKDTGFKIFLQPAGYDSIHPLIDGEESLILSYRLDEYGIQFRFHPSDFTQINMEINRQMVKQAIHLLGVNTNDIILDLFCGLGNFSLPIATVAQQVVGIEGSDLMVERSKMNASLNHLSNLEFFNRDLFKADGLADFDLKRFNKVLIDPPRSGALEVVKQFGTYKPEKLLYVSCNPATLARDAKVLVNEFGYVLSKAGVMDMFPHTSHVESMALFERK